MKSILIYNDRLIVDDELILSDKSTQEILSSKEFKRAQLYNKVSADYDKWVDCGLPISVTFQNNQYTVLERDIAKLGGVCGVAALAIHSGSLLITDQLISHYKFKEGPISMTGVELLELCNAYISQRTQRFQQHNRVKDSIGLGVMPNIDDYVACGLNSDHFLDLELTES